MTNKVLNSDIAKQYDTRKSISDHLPWVEWSDAENIVLLEDFKSCGALLEIQDISTEAKPQEMIEEIHKNVKGVFQSVVPLEDKDPWIVQIYIQDDLTLDPLNRRLEEYVKDPDDPLTKKYLSIMARHFKLLGREQGMFRDPLSDLNFRGRTRRIRLAVYRRYEDENNKASKSKKKLDVVNELRVVTETLMTQLRQGGMNVRRLKGQHFYEWLVRWFNPKPAITDGDQDELLKAYPYPGATKPHGWNFTQNVFFDTVKDEEGAWVFDGIKHKVMVFQDLQDQLDIGVISRERSFGSGKNHYALIDKFPPGTIYTMQLIFESKTAVEKHLNTIKKAAVGQELVIQEVKRNVERAFYEVANGNMLFRSSEALYIRAATHEELEENERNIRALLVSSGLTTVKTEEELYPQDVYLRFLPFNFSYAFDKKNSFRSTYKYADDIARLLPVYGRSKGDGMNPLVIGYNRGGEPFIYDHSSNDFKQSNSHMFICGTTGSGKSVSLNSLILAMSAVSNPRIIAIEVGGSFDLTTKFLSAHGRNVRTLKFSRKDPIVLNPYSEAYKALEMVEREEALLAKLAIKDPADLLEAKAKQIEEEIKALAEPLVIEADDDTREDRDILTEMMLATRIMVTGGDDRENEKISRSDMMLIMQTLIHSMKKCRDAGAPQMLVQHVAAG
ncbi:MAG: conjugative transfer ATPase, partial [Gammaproteobacteria bacterium]|nr:conjugative transfer ATPase [Gammaproteobacteria bacterium]